MVVITELPHVINDIGFLNSDLLFVIFLASVCALICDCLLKLLQ